MFVLLDQLVLAHFSAKTINCSSAMLPIYLEARLAICQHFDDNGILSINFFGMVCVCECVYNCAHRSISMPTFVIVFLGCFPRTHTRTHTERYVCTCGIWTDGFRCCRVVFSRAAAANANWVAFCFALYTILCLFICLCVCVCDCDESMWYQAKLCYTHTHTHTIVHTLLIISNNSFN